MTGETQKSVSLQPFSAIGPRGESRWPLSRRSRLFRALSSRRFTLGSRSSLPSFPSVQGLFAPSRTSFEIPSTSLTSWKMTIEPNDRQVAGNAKSILEIQVKSEIGDVAALDNVARFAGNEATTGEG